MIVCRYLMITLATRTHHFQAYLHEVATAARA